MRISKSQEIEWKYCVAGLFLISAILRFFLGYFYPKTINCYPDELLYLSLGESIWNHHNLQVFNAATSFNKVAYPIIIAPAFAFGDVKNQMMLIALINAVVMSLGIFPVYGLARSILTEKKDILFCVILYTVSSSMTYSMTYMSENLSIPLSLIFVYLLYRYWDEENILTKSLLGAILALLMFLCYVTKYITLVFPIAIVMVLLTNWLFGNERRKRILAIIIGIIMLYMGLFVGHLKFFPTGMTDKIGYVIYGFLFFCVFSVLGFCIIPVLLPGIRYGKMDEASRKLYLFLVYVVVITGAVIACMIYPVEDYPSMTPRAHLRYVEFLFVPFVILFLNSVESEAQATSKKIISIVFGVWGALFLAVFRGFSGQTIDQTMLFYWQLFAKDGKNFSELSVKLLCCIIVLIVAVLLSLYSHRREFFKKMVLIALLTVNVGNSVISIYVQYKTHSHTEGEVNEMEALREFVCEHKEDKFLVLEPANYCEMIDTFLIDCDNVRTGLSPAPMQDERTFEMPINLSYAIVCNQGYSIAEDAKLVVAYPNLGYSLYEIKGDRVLEE